MILNGEDFGFSVKSANAKIISSVPRDVNPRRVRGLRWKNKERNFVTGMGFTSCGW